MRRPRLRKMPPYRPVAPEALLELRRSGPAPLVPFAGSTDALHVAWIVPGFARGSGGHSTIAHVVRGLQARGHRCSIWIDDLIGLHAAESEQRTLALFEEFFGAVGGTVHKGLDAWAGADVVVATGWETAYRVARLPGAAARAYFVQDHEPDFFGASAERLWATETYGLGLHGIAASEWLAALLRDRYGMSATSFALGVDHDVYAPLPVQREQDLVVGYARGSTPRRAVPLALLALEELKRRRPDVRIELFGGGSEPLTRFEKRWLGVVTQPGLAELYSRATAGIVLSLSNPSLVPTEMLACGLPVVDVASDPMLATFGADGPVALAPPDPMALADALERLLGDQGERERRSREGISYAAQRSWPAAVEAVEAGLRQALAAAG